MTQLERRKSFSSFYKSRYVYTECTVTSDTIDNGTIVCSKMKRKRWKNIFFFRALFRFSRKCENLKTVWGAHAVRTVIRFTSVECLLYTYETIMDDNFYAESLFSYRRAYILRANTIRKCTVIHGEPYRCNAFAQLLNRIFSKTKPRRKNVLPCYSIIFSHRNTSVTVPPFIAKHRTVYPSVYPMCICDSTWPLIMLHH